MMALTDNLRNELQVVFQELSESKEQHPVNFDDMCNWLGLKRPRDAAKTLVRSYQIDVDYTQEDKRDMCRSYNHGSPKKIYWLTVNCFKQFCMRSSAPRSTPIRQYYIDIENAARQFCDDVGQGKYIVTKANDPVIWHKKRKKALKSTKEDVAVLHDRYPKATAKLYAMHNGALNKAATGMSKSEMGRILHLGPKRRWIARDHMTEDQLQLLGTGCVVSKGIHSQPTTEDTQKKEMQLVLDAMTMLRDLGGLGGKLLKAPPVKNAMVVY